MCVGGKHLKGTVHPQDAIIKWTFPTEIIVDTVTFSENRFNLQRVTVLLKITHEHEQIAEKQQLHASPWMRNVAGSISAVKEISSLRETKHADENF